MYMYIHSIHTIILHYFTHRIKAPQCNAHIVGIRARQQAKLGSILDQVHSGLIKEKTKGKPPQSRDNKHGYTDKAYALQVPCVIQHIPHSGTV